LSILQASDSIRSGHDPIKEFERLVALGSFRTATTADQVLAPALRKEIDEQFATRLTLRHLAAKHHVHIRRLNKSFRAVFGVGVLAYLRSQRVMHGLRLVASGMKIESAARDVGFRSKKDFYRAVRFQTGFTPGEYRSKKTNSNDS
jgi:methylphosphotriester-DNA--protein-cysteine methyltransferase